MNFIKHLTKISAALLLIAAGVLLLRSGKSIPLETEGNALLLPEMKTAQMKREFHDMKVDVRSAAQNGTPVPRIFALSVPDDFNRSKYDADRKELFLNMVLPAVLRANEEVEAERARLLSLEREYRRTGKLPPAYAEEARRIARKYDSDAEEPATLFAKTKLRVDFVPASLLLALSIEATGWGTNEFARKHNALFMEKSWDGTGIDSGEAQKEGPQYKIKSFPTIYDAVRSFIFYLNTGNSFHPFRVARDVFRREGDKIRGYTAASQMMNFPYKPFEYPDILKHLMEENKMMKLDLTELDADLPAVAGRSP